MGHDQEGCALRSCAQYRSAQRCLPIRIEICVGLVEQYQFTVAEEGSCQADALSLATREAMTVATDLRLIPGRQCQNHLMRASQSCRHDDIFVARALLKSRDRFSNGTGEQFDILRKIADVASELIGVPALQQRVVEPDFTDAGLLQGGRHPQESGLARAGRTNDHDDLAGPASEGNTSQDRTSRLRNGEADTIEFQ